MKANRVKRMPVQTVQRSQNRVSISYGQFSRYATKALQTHRNWFDPQHKETASRIRVAIRTKRLSIFVTEGKTVVEYKGELSAVERELLIKILGKELEFVQLPNH